MNEMNPVRITSATDLVSDFLAANREGSGVATMVELSGLFEVETLYGTFEVSMQGGKYLLRDESADAELGPVYVEFEPDFYMRNELDRATGAVAENDPYAFERLLRSVADARVDGVGSFGLRKLGDYTYYRVQLWEPEVIEMVVNPVLERLTYERLRR